MKSAFLDASYLIALEFNDDQSHESALNHWQQWTREPFSVVLTSLVFDEIVTFLNSRGFHQKAVLAGDRLLSSSSVRLLQVDETLFRRGWQYFKKHRDKSYSLTDCISFMLMDDLKLRSALTFDRHFQQAGFEMLP